MPLYSLSFLAASSAARLFILFYYSIIPLTEITFLIITFFFFPHNGLCLFILCWPAGHHPITRLTLHPTLRLPFQEPSHCTFCRPGVIRFIYYSYQRVYSDSFDQTVCSDLFLAHSTYRPGGLFFTGDAIHSGLISTNIDKYISNTGPVILCFC